MNERPIVVGVDGSAVSRAALLWAARAADALNSPLSIVLAGDGDGPGELGAGATSTSQAILDGASDLVARSTSTCNVTTHLVEDQPDPVLERVSAAASMIVVGNSGESRLVALLLGSVSHHIAAYGQCPIVVVPTEWIDRTPKAHPLIVVGVSPTPGGNAALEFAMSFAARDDGDILAVRAWDRHKMSSDDPMAAADRQSIVLNTMVDEAKHAHPSVTVNSQLAPGAVADALRHVAIGADLLVVGTRFTSGEYGSRLGSIASGLLHRMPCPVLVVSAGQEIELRSHASTSGWTELEQSALPVS